jgi:hypothetical protein
VRTESDLRKLFDSSGYPFQLRIEHEIRSAQKEHGWQIIGSEYPWKDPKGEGQGFADIVIRRDQLVAVVECKRLAEAATYLFLVPEGSGGQTHRFRCLGAHFPGSIVQRWWDDVWLEPETTETQFCVVEGTGPKDRPILERVGAELVVAVEAVLNDEIRLHTRVSKHQRFWAGFPILVTNAQLVVCEYAPADVDPGSGKLLPGAGTFREVSTIQLRKGLSLDAARRAREESSLTELYERRQRSILIVHSSKLVQVLSSWTIQPLQSLGPVYPWMSH